MTNIDQFESLFKKADKPRFQLEPVEMDSILIVTDVDPAQTEVFTASIVDFLKTTQLQESIHWHPHAGDQHSSVNELLEHIDSLKPDLICTYRNLHAPATDYPHSLGVYLDVLSQVTSVPVLVLPSPHRDVSMPTSTREAPSSARLVKPYP